MMYTLLLKNSARLEQFRLASSPLRRTPFQHITVCHLNGDSLLPVSSSCVKNTPPLECGNNGSIRCSATSASAAPASSFSLPTDDTSNSSVSSPEHQSVYSELITVLRTIENSKKSISSNSESSALTSGFIRLQPADLSRFSNFQESSIKNFKGKEPRLICAPGGSALQLAACKSNKSSPIEPSIPSPSAPFSPTPQISRVDISINSVTSASIQAKTNNAKSIEQSLSDPKLQMQQRVYVNSESTDSSDFGPTVSRQAASIPNSSISHTLTESDSSAPPTPLMTGSPREETPEALRRQMVANAEFEDVAESLIVDLMRAIGRRKTLSEEVRSLCLAALRTLVVAHPKSIYLRPILEEKRAQQHAAAAAAASLEELAKQRKKSSQKSATTTTTTTNQSNGEDVVEDQSASKAPQKPAKGAPFPKELKYPLPFTVVEYISKVDNFNRQFLCYIDVCYGAKMGERVDQLLEHYERASRSIEGITNGYLIYDLNIYASIARHYAQTMNIEGIQKLFTLLSNSNLTPDYELVAYCFEAFARYAKKRSPELRSAGTCESANANANANTHATAVDSLTETNAKSLKSLLADTQFPRLLDQIRRTNLVAPGNIRERFNPAAFTNRCRFRSEEQLSLIRSILDTYFPPAANAQKPAAAADIKASVKVYSTNSLLTHFLPSAPPPVSSAPQSSEPSTHPPAPFARNPFAGVLPASPEDRERLISEQFAIEEATQLELDSFDASFYSRKSPLTDAQLQAKYKRTMDSLREKWRTSLIEGFHKMVSRIESPSPPPYKSRFKYHQPITYSWLLNYRSDMIGYSSIHLLPFFKLLKPEEYVDILLKEMETLCSNNANYSPVVSVVRANIARAVMMRHLANRMKYETPAYSLKMKDAYRLYLDKFNSSRLEGGLLRVAWIDSLHAASVNSIEHPLWRTQEPWTWDFQVNVGKHLLDLLMRTVTFDATSYPFSSSSGFRYADDPEDRNLSQTADFDPKRTPVLHSVTRQRGDDFRVEIKAHGKVSQLQDAVNGRRIAFAATALPNLLPPMPWIAPNLGGYALQTQSLVRLPEETRRAQTAVTECLRQTPLERMHAVMDAISCVSSCPWRVNRNVMDVAGKMFADGGNKALALPHSEAHFNRLTNEAYKNMRGRQLEQRLRELKKEKREAFSLWSYERFRFTIAQHFKDRVFFLPHTLDFRGRCYPTPPHFQHMGGDLSRGMLQFAQGKPLGERGLFWLKVHLANLYGQAKKSALSEKIKWVDANLKNIEASVANANAPDAWWKKADEPFQSLSVCYELVGALNSPDPSAYCARQPIHQDGSCNVLQHYAAMGRDQKGAEAVNLCPLDVPQDVYSDVVKMVEGMRQRDAEAGVSAARLLQGCITRKVIKQTVMTTSYGVTAYGAREQIGRQLKDVARVPKECIFEAREYLQKKVFEALDNMFVVSKHIKQWFSDNAYNISTLRQQPVRWTTPLGFTVVQPYFHKPSKGKPSFSIFDPPKAMKQKTAFPPNFVHSLDAVHMMLTALHCNRAGITFAAVHDCFWTHPCDVDQMNRICREQFIALHQLPILKNLSTEFKSRYGFESQYEFDYFCFSNFSLDIPYEISRVSRPHVERFHEALEQLPPTTVLASDSVAASAEKNTDPAVGLEDDSIDEVLGVSLDEIRELPFWKEPADTEERSRLLLNLNELLDQVPPQGNFDIKNVLKSTYFFA